MALTNAEHQALWRKRQKAKLEAAEDDFDLYVRATKPLLANIRLEFKKHIAQRVPQDVVHCVIWLERMNEAWPTLPLATKQAMANAKTVSKVTQHLPNPNLRK